MRELLSYEGGYEIILKIFLSAEPNAVAET